MAECNQSSTVSLRRGSSGWPAAALPIVIALSGCATGDEASGGYPSLRSVPEAARASTPLDERRDIVRSLIEQRDRSRRQTSVVRARSGLDVDRFPSPADDNVRAEDIIPDASGGDGEGFRLTPGRGESADSVYRGESQFEDGSLDDFIRKLKRETRPPAPAGAPAGAEAPPASGESENDDVDVRSLLSEPASAMVLAALAPVARRGLAGEGEFVIRLAAAGEEPGFFCSYFGWTVAWSSMCVDAAETQPTPEGGEGVGADLGDETEGVEDDATPDSRRSARSRSSTSGETGQERAERRLSEEDAADAIENAGRDALAPVTSSLEKLRDFIEARRSGGGASSREERSPVLRRADPAAPEVAADRPPLPQGRPKRREDITVADGGETFDFVRTPLPHFKPARDDQVILPPAKAGPNGSARPPRPHLKPAFDSGVSSILPPGRPGERRAETRPPPQPLARPSDLAGERQVSSAPSEGRERLDAAIVALADGVAEIEPSDGAGGTKPDTAARTPLSTEATDLNETPPSLAAIEPAAPPADEVPEPDPIIITFEPETPGLPQGSGPRLAALLTHASVTDQKIHIIGEASTNHLARRRATDVGAALVQLGATVEILEYDHQARSDVDQVRLVLRPAPIEE
ncbi:MAG: hypothetical protein ACR2RA_16530 [Geminicoccaceae bacterium]